MIRRRRPPRLPKHHLQQMVINTFQDRPCILDWPSRPLGLASVGQPYHSVGQPPPNRWTSRTAAFFSSNSDTEGCGRWSPSNGPCSESSGGVSSLSGAANCCVSDWSSVSSGCEIDMLIVLGRGSTFGSSPTVASFPSSPWNVRYSASSWSSVSTVGLVC